MKRKTLILFLLGAVLLFPLPAQDNSTVQVDGTVKSTEVVPAETTDTTLEDELFGSDEDLLLDKEETTMDNMGGVKLKGELATATLALETKKLHIGGRLDSSLDLDYRWENVYEKKINAWKYFTEEANGVLRPTLAAQLFFDARPTKNSKIYGKFMFGFPFEKTISGSLPAPKSLQPSVPNFRVQELYTDFSAKDIAFFRFGKHTVKWGTGYFYSPADVLNITRIDPQDPTADREGSVSLRSHIIVPKTQHNIWLYALPDTKNFKPEQTAIAAKAEFVVKNWELGIGGWYRYQKAPRLIATMSGSIAGKVSIFGEGVFAWGSDYTYHNNDTTFSKYTLPNKPFFQATLGGSYSNADTHTSLALQYFYNGFGYINPNAVFYPAIKIAKANPSDEKARATVQDFGAMGNSGQHYIALTLAQNKIGTDKLQATLFQQFAVSELEGTSILKLHWNIYKFVSISSGINFTYPLSSKSASKGSVGWTLGFQLGGGKF